MLQMVLHEGEYNIYIQIALGLFVLAFVILLLVTLLRPKKLDSHDAHLPLEDDTEPPRDTHAAQSDESGQEDKPHD